MDREACNVAVHGTLPAAPWRLADGCWPRTGADRRHSRRVGVLGPSRGSTRAVCALPGPSSALAQLAAAEESIWISRADHLLCFDLRGELRWSAAAGDPERARFTSAPLILSDGTAVLRSGRRLSFVSARGVVGRVDWTGADDSGPAPNLTADGRIVLTSMSGEVALASADGAVTPVGSFGYDILPPAIQDDGTLVISGYGGSGLVCVTPSGERVWAGDSRDPDLLPSVDASGVVAVGALGGGSSFHSPSGGRLGSYREGAAFAELGGGQWAALGRTSLACVDSSGVVSWTRALGGEIDLAWGGLGPVIDQANRVYFPRVGGFACVTRSGEAVFDLDLPATPSDVAIVSEGVAAVVVGDALHLVT